MREEVFHLLLVIDPVVSYPVVERYPHARCEVDACDPCGIVHFISGVREVTDRCGKLLY